MEEIFRLRLGDSLKRVLIIGWNLTTCYTLNKDHTLLSRQAPLLLSLCFQFSEQAIGNDAWENGQPLQEEEDLWDDARLQVCIGYILSGLNALYSFIPDMHDCVKRRITVF